MTSISQQSAKNSGVLSRLKRDLLYHAPRLLGGWLLARNVPRLALISLKIADNTGPATFQMLRQMEAANRQIGRIPAARKYQHRLRIARLQRYTRTRDFRKIFDILASLEKSQLPAPLEVGRLISREIVKESGRALILRTARAARKKNPRSVYLIHLVTMCEATQGDYRKASQTIARELARPLQADNPKEKRRFTALRNCWRMVDLIARDQMDFVGDSGDYSTIMDTAETKLSPQAEAVVEDSQQKLASSEYEVEVSAATEAAIESVAQRDETPEESRQLLQFKEHYLQGRLQSEYLEACDRDFANATILFDKLNVISEMLRQGVRRVLSYADAYALATQRLKELIAADPNIFKRNDKQAGGVRRVVTELCSMLKLTRRLEMTAESAAIVARLVSLSNTLKYKPMMWAAAAEISEDVTDLDDANRIITNLGRLEPKTTIDVKGYFRWAKFSGKYKQADAMFQRLGDKLRFTPQVLDYVNILERRGSFQAALDITNDIHAHLLANPSRVDPLLNQQLITRIGELRFLTKTAQLFQSVPQPSEPKGIVLVSPRNIKQLRLHPLMVLIEMKRQGWAVIPTVEGLLPRQLTGNPALDVMNGAIMRTTAIHPGRADVLKDVNDFVFEGSTGRLHWKNLDLSHSIWEDAAVNRRCYSVDYGCPSLRRYLSNLADWTRSTARVLDYAHKLHRETGIKVATMALFNSRLPDSLHRLFCNEYGNPDSFFALHAANGYQNYFTNFATNVSQRFVLRNVTKASEVRSASFPVPENFERYYEENRARLPEMLERFAGVTKIKRSTDGIHTKPQEVIDASEKIAAWRAKGGKVACAFGKVVCDSSVPFDGGPAHANMKDWINDCVRAVKGSNTLLLIKPHPHEMNNSIATFPNEFFTDLITEPVDENVLILGHRWFDMFDMKDRIDIGLIYNGTTAIELGIMGIPCVLAGHFAPIDYPIGHVVPKDRQDFRRLVRFEKPTVVAPDIVERAACWLDYMASDRFTLSYRYHTRPVTNKLLYPPTWFAEDLEKRPDPEVIELTARAFGEAFEPGERTGEPEMRRPLAMGA